MIRSFLVLFALSVPVPGQTLSLATLPPAVRSVPPGDIVAIVTGPTECLVGQSIFLDASASAGGTEFTWSLVNQSDTVSFVPLTAKDGREIALFTASESGEYSILLAVAEQPGVQVSVKGNGRPVLIVLGNAESAEIRVEDLGSNSYVLAAAPSGSLAAVIHTITVAGSVPPAPPPEPVPEPTVEMQRTVAPIAEALDGHPEQAGELSVFYLDLADVIERDGEGAGKIGSTRHVRDAHWLSLTLAFQGDWESLGLKEPIDGAFEQTFGLEVRDLTDDLRAEVVELCRAIAWACGEAE